jgi:hypothetical protein
MQHDIGTGCLCIELTYINSFLPCFCNEGVKEGKTLSCENGSCPFSFQKVDVSFVTKMPAGALYKIISLCCNRSLLGGLILS